MGILTKVAKIKDNYFSDECVLMLKKNESDIERNVYYIHHHLIEPHITTQDKHRLDMLLKNGYDWVKFKNTKG